MAVTLWPSMPVMESAAIIALTMASSVAWATAGEDGAGQPAGGNSGDSEIRARAEVALNEDTDRIAAVFFYELARRRADATFIAAADHAGAAADVAFFDAAGLRGIHGVEGVFGFDVEAVDVV